VLLILFVLCVTPAFAATGVLDISPESLTITAVSGDSSDTGLTIRNLEYKPRDLALTFIRTKETGDYHMLQPDSMAIAVQSKTIAPRGIVDVPVMVNSRQLGSGEYRGTILVLSNDTEIAIPVTLKVKDAFLPPLLVLGLTVLISVLVFNWGHTWQKYTILKRNLAVIWAKVEGDELLSKNEYAAYFRQKIIAALDEGDNRLQARDFDKADEARKKAEQYWDRWYRNRVKWKEHLDESVNMKKYIDVFVSDFTEFGGSFTFLKDLSEDLENAWAKIADSSEEEIPFSPVDEIGTLKLTNVETLFRALIQTRDYCIKNGGDDGPCRKKFNEFLDKLRGVRSSELKDIAPFLNQLNDIRGTPPEHKGKGPGRGGEGYAISRMLSGTTLKERFINLTPAQVTEVLSKRLLWGEFAIGTVLPIIVLMAAGMLLLYVPNPTFGSGADYLSLVMWGIMSCVTKDGIWEKISPLVTSKTAS
jgi:hypothetical protein